MTSRAMSACGRSTRTPESGPACDNACTRTSARYSPGTRSALSPCSARWSAVVAPTQQSLTPPSARTAQQPLHERIDRVRAREHDPVEAAGVRTRVVQWTVILRRLDAQHGRLD